MKAVLPLLFSSVALALIACAPPASHNTYNGLDENYACFHVDGTVELKLSESELPSCTKLSEMPPEDAKIVVEAAENEQVIPPGTIKIDRGGL